MGITLGGPRGGWLRATCAVALLLVLLVACGESTDGTVPDTGSDTEAGTISDTSLNSRETIGESDNPIEALYQEALDAGGEVVLYTHISADEQREALVQAFQERFPGMTVEHTGAVGQQLLERLLTEKRAGLASADVFQYPGAAPFTGVLLDEDFLEPYTPSEASLYEAEGIYVDGLAYPWSVYHMVACYNPDNVTDEEIELLRTYEGWTDPVWAGRANIVAPTGGTYLRSMTYWALEDPDLGEDWLTRLAALQPTVFTSANPATDRVIAGEYDVTFNAFSANAARQAEFGAPLRCAYQEYTVTIPAPMALIADGPNPVGGKLWIEWQLSEEGQAISQRTTHNPSAREGMEGIPPVDVDWWEWPREIVAADETLVEEHQEEIIDMFARLFGGLGE